MKYLGMLCLVSLFACSKQTSENGYFQMDFERQVDRLIVKDSIALFDSLHFFNYGVNIDRLEENKVLAAQVPGLRVFLLDSTGRVQKKITQKGNAPGMLGNSNFALSTIGDSGQIYVLTAGNIYRLFVFDSDGEYLESYPFYQLLPELYVPPVNNSFSVIEKPNGQILLSFGVGSTRYEPYTLDFFTLTFGIAQFLINQEKAQVLEYHKKVPLSEIEEIEAALDSKKVFWSQSNPMFDYEEGKFYLSFPFSTVIRVYDENFNLLNIIPIETLKPLERVGFEHPMGKSSDSFYRRTRTNERLRQENLNINNIDVRDGKLLLQFSEIFEEGSYPLTKEEEIYNIRALPYSYYQHVVIKDLASDEEAFITLPEHVFETMLKDDKTIWAAYVPPEVEAKYLIEYLWN